MTLDEAFELFAGALAPFGIEIEGDVLDIWRDRARHGQEPLPLDALGKLGHVAEQIADGLMQ